MADTSSVSRRSPYGGFDTRFAPSQDSRAFSISPIEFQAVMSHSAQVISEATPATLLLYSALSKTSGSTS